MSLPPANSQKGEKPAEEFLRGPYRLRRLNGAELADRLRALEKLAQGKLKPALTPPAKSIRRKRRPRLCRAA